MKTNQILYISYDGMTDPIGKSQVIPYIIELSKKGYAFTVLSCEKKDRLNQFKSEIEDTFKSYNIQWKWTLFTTCPPLLAKYYDLIRLLRKAKKLHKEFSYRFIHCRSYVSAEIAYKLKLKTGVKYLFDMRGFWVDERIEGNIWNIKNPIHSLLYRYYKRKEKQFINNSDYIIVLSKNALKEVTSWKSYNQNPIDVIPCSVNFEEFNLVTAKEKTEFKQNLGYKNSDLVVSYLGSLGTWYLLDEMLCFFALLKRYRPKAKFLFVSPENPDKIHMHAKKYDISEKDLFIQFVNRNEVRKTIGASDISLSFIKPSYSKKASSPTKLGELFALGVPVICNANVGDVEEIVRTVNGGMIVHEFTKNQYFEVIKNLDKIMELDNKQIRLKARSYYEMENAVSLYEKAYNELKKNEV